MCSACQNVSIQTYPITMKAIGLEMPMPTKLNVGISVETGYFKSNGITYLAYDPQMNGIVRIHGDGRDFLLPFRARFFYFLNYNERIYCFFQGGGGIQANYSDDLINWEPMNGGRPVLNNDGGLFVTTWNVAVAVDDAGLFHMLVECAHDASPYSVGMSYLTANLIGSTLNFNLTKKSSMDIVGGGNPELKFIPNVGLISVHGQAMDAFNDNFWYLTISTLPIGQTVWNQKKDHVKLWADKIHVADPSILDNGSSLTFSFSYDQNSSYQILINKTYEELFYL